MSNVVSRTSILLILLLSIASSSHVHASEPAGATLQASQLAPYKGEIVLVDFWASWCGPCRRSFPWLNDMQAKYGDQGFKVVGVNLDKHKDDALGFLERYPAKFDILYDDATLARHFEVETMPSSFLLDRNGTIIHRHRGFTTKRAPVFEAEIAAVLKAAASTTTPMTTGN